MHSLLTDIIAFREDLQCRFDNFELRIQPYISVNVCWPCLNDFVLESFTKGHTAVGVIKDEFFIAGIRVHRVSERGQCIRCKGKHNAI